MMIRSFTFGTALTAALTASMLVSSTVRAADLDPALEDPAQVYGSLPSANVVFGSGWYARGDAAVTNLYKVGVSQPSGSSFSSGIVSSGSPTYDLSLGGGYAFTNHLRADLLVDFFQPSQSNMIGDALCHSGLTSACTLIGQFNRYDALANGYFDIGTWWVATPYVGAGVGVAFGNVKASLYDTSVYSGHIGYHNLAFAGMAGVAFDVYPHVKIDAGYRYVNNGRVGGTEIFNHEFRAGLRYMIDN